jgi:hypothetical protein
VGAHSGVTWAYIPGTWAGRTRPVLTRRKRRAACWCRLPRLLVPAFSWKARLLVQARLLVPAFSWKAIQRRPGSPASGRTVPEGDDPNTRFVVKLAAIGQPRVTIIAAGQQIFHRWQTLSGTFPWPLAGRAGQQRDAWPGQAVSLRGSCGGKAQRGNMSLISRARSRRRRAPARKASTKAR